MRGFRSNSESEYSIHAAAGSGNIDEVKKQLANGTDVNKKNGIGMIFSLDSFSFTSFSNEYNIMKLMKMAMMVVQSSNLWTH